MSTDDNKAYLEKRSPREGPRRTKRHSEWCTPGRRWSRGPSTSEGDAPGAGSRCRFNCFTVLSSVRWIFFFFCQFGGTHISLADVVGVFVDISGEAKVTDLDHVVLWEQDVSGCQISVDTLQSNQDNSQSHIKHDVRLNNKKNCGFTLREDRNSMPLDTWKL